VIKLSGYFIATVQKKFSMARDLLNIKYDTGVDCIYFRVNHNQWY
jgi:hypothetical protein